MTYLCDDANLCVVCQCKPIVTCSEKHRKYILHNTLDNKYRVGKLQYDKGYYKSNGEAADCIILTCERKDRQPKVAIVVELKGVDVDKALSQLSATIERETNLLHGYVIFARTSARAVRRAHQNSPKRKKLLSLLSNANREYKLPARVLFREQESLDENIANFYKLLEC